MLSKFSTKQMIIGSFCFYFAALLIFMLLGSFPDGTPRQVLFFLMILCIALGALLSGAALLRELFRNFKS